MKKPFFENLDGLRFLAFFTVFLSHTFSFAKFKFESEQINKWVRICFLHGTLGVVFFFVLSGFLITYLLLNEKHTTKNISIPNFYIRRVLRIWPLYFLVVFLGFFVVPFLFQGVTQHNLPLEINIPLSDLPWYLGFAVNVDIVLHGPKFMLVVILWSISVEEQFYLLWPLINKYASKILLISIMFLIVVSAVYYRLINHNEQTTLKFSTFSVMDSLAIGSLAGVWSFYSNEFRKVFIQMRRRVIASIYFLFFVCLGSWTLMYRAPINILSFLTSIQPLVFSLFFAFIILEQNYSCKSLFKISRFKLLSQLGALSYGLYCYHMICFFIVAFFFNMYFETSISKSFFLFMFQFIVTLFLSIFLSWLSYRYFEAKFLALKHRFSK